MEKLGKFLHQDFILGAGVIAILAMLIIPLPGLLLDLLIVISVTVGIVVLLTSLTVKSSAEFSVFPTLLLVTTIYRLALNVSTTRLILTKGPEANSNIISAFSSFVVGGSGGQGSLVIGVVIFIILVLVQIVVITKGATRISEVSARFKLDALPGKQMAIDNELSNGMINDQEAKLRRTKVENEANFYGAMDGASKFVQGDVRLGLIITAVNVIAGLVAGMSIRGESFSSALQTYVSFTIGDGLVSQIPALLITTATGIIVTRSVSGDHLLSDINSQMLQNPKTLWLVSLALVGLAFVPGLPTVTLLVVAIAIAGLAYYLKKEEVEAGIKKDAVGQEAQSAPREAENNIEYIKVEPLELEIGFSLVPLVNTNSGGTLLDKIGVLRKQFAMSMGMLVPAIRIRDNMDLEPEAYQIKVNGIVVASSSVESTRLMAVNTGKVTDSIDGKEFIEPSFNRPAMWIDPEQKNDAENKGYDVVEPNIVLITHLQKIITAHAPDILGRQQVSELVDHLKKKYPAVTAELFEVAQPMSLGLLQKVLQNLLREQVSIRNLVGILEAIADYYPGVADPFSLTEVVRSILGRQIVMEYVGDDKTIYVITVDPALEKILRSGLTNHPGEGMMISLSPGKQLEVREAFAALYNEIMKQQKHLPIFLVAQDLRQAVFGILAREFPTQYFAVLAHSELTSDIKMEFLGQVELKKEKPQESALAGVLG